jgi:hypothetical protein
MEAYFCLDFLFLFDLSKKKAPRQGFKNKQTMSATAKMRGNQRARIFDLVRLPL